MRPAFRRLLPVLLLAAALLAGQWGVPVEDGGEVATVARLGGTMHPPGMPLLALSAQSTRLLGEDGLRLLFALCSTATLWLVLGRTGLAGAAAAFAVLLLPGFRERALAWDAYGLLMLVFSAVLTARTPLRPLAAGYLAGIAASIHPAGILLPAACRLDSRPRLPELAGSALLGASLYLALPLASAAGAAVDWGSPGAIAAFVRQVGAGGYREVYGASMGRLDPAVAWRHLSTLSGMAWPALLLPAGAGAAGLLRRDRGLLLRLGILLAADVAFTVLVNPMAAGTGQTAWLSLVCLLVLASEGLRVLPGTAAWAAVAAVAVTGALREGGLRDQEPDVRAFLAGAPLEPGLFISDNDLLYGCWVMKYGRDLRPDAVLLSTGNFSPWFERLAGRYNPELDTSGGLAEAGGPGTPRDSVVARLVRLTILNNPGRRFFTDT
jgi:hypothetical protein